MAHISDVLARLQSMGCRTFCFHAPSRLPSHARTFHSGALKLASPQWLRAQKLYTRLSVRHCSLSSAGAFHVPARGAKKYSRTGPTNTSDNNSSGKNSSKNSTHEKKTSSNRDEKKEESKEQEQGGFKWFKRKKPAEKKPRKAKNLYEVLGVSKDAKHEDIKARYLELAKKHHPDTGSADPSKFAEFSSAWSVLGNKASREQYNARMELMPDADTEYDFEEQEATGLQVIVSTGCLKYDGLIVEMSPTLLKLLVHLGVPQVDGDTPQYKSYNPLKFWWTLLALFVLRLLYVTYRDWRSPYTGDEGHPPRTKQERSTFFWRLIGLSLCCSICLLRIRKMDLLSKYQQYPDIESDPRRKQLADLVVRLMPKCAFTLWFFTFFTGPIAQTAHDVFFQEKDFSERISDVMPTMEYNCSRVCQIVAMAGGVALAGARANALGVALVNCDRQMFLGAVVGRVVGWLYSFALVGRHRRKQMKKRREEQEKRPPIFPPQAGLSPENEEARKGKVQALEAEVQRLRSELQERQQKEATATATGK